MSNGFTFCLINNHIFAPKEYHWKVNDNRRIMVIVFAS